MVWDHVAQRAGRLVEVAASLDPHRFGHRDLHMVDAIPVPDRLKEAVGEAQRHDALHRVLAEEMIDAENLILAQHAEDAGVEELRRCEVVAEGLLDHDAPPIGRSAVGVGMLARQSGGPELLDDGLEETVGDGEVEDDVARLDLLQLVGQSFIGLRLGDVAPEIGHFVREPGPGPLVDAGRVELGA